MARAKRPRIQQDNLEFVRTAKMSGFRASGLSAYNNVDPHTVVRELVQNALDAAMEAKRDVIRVFFEIDEVDASRIPALAQYCEHLQCAIKTQREKKNLAQSQSIVDAMEAVLYAGKARVLWVLDNGIGLNAQGMEDLLGDGQSGKADESTAGSYGNGHMTSFPASDMRYILYGGVHAQGRTVSGHAILASHMYKRKMCGEDGYLANTMHPNALFDRFEFFDGSSMPLLDEKLHFIEQNFTTGSVVGILGFNRFNRFSNDDDVLAVIETVVATHFTPVIFDGRMEIGLSSRGKTLKTIDKSALKPILARRRKRERRDRNSIGPSGGQAWDTLQSLEPGYAYTIQTKYGKVRFHFRELLRTAGGATHIQLFRNGMWITNDVPHNKASDYRNVVPFSGVILLSPELAKDACRLVGTFEGPRHIDIDLTRQRRGSAPRKALDEFLKELHERILELAPEIDIQHFDPGFFSVEVPGDGERRNPRARTPGIGTPERVPRPDPIGPPRPPSPNPNPKPPPRLRRQGRRIDTRVASVRRTRGIRIRAKPLDDAVNAELRVVVANGSDATCDSPEPDHYLEIGQGATVSGQPVKAYVPDRHGKHRAVLLGPVSNSADELDIWLPCRPTLAGDIRVELVRRAASKRGS